VERAKRGVGHQDIAICPATTVNRNGGSSTQCSGSGLLRLLRQLQPVLGDLQPAFLIGRSSGPLGLLAALVSMLSALGRCKHYIPPNTLRSEFSNAACQPTNHAACSSRKLATILAQVRLRLEMLVFARGCATAVRWAIRRKEARRTERLPYKNCVGTPMGFHI
jgi:hypothetical protein